MSSRTHVIATLMLFAVFAAYGLQATAIPSFPGQELEPFKPRTMPMMLAAIGLILCVVRVLQIVRAARPETRAGISGFNWKPAILLCMTMVVYGLLMNPLGFVAATVLFLSTGFLILGERRKLVLALLPLTFSLAFYLLMTVVLGMYLSPGAWWSV